MVIFKILEKIDFRMRQFEMVDPTFLGGFEVIPSGMGLEKSKLEGDFAEVDQGLDAHLLG